MNSLKFLILCFFLAFMFGCPRPADVIIKRNVIVRDYDKKKDNDKNRDDILKNSNQRYSGKACEEEDRRHECHEQCSDIYSSRRGDVKDCEELKIGLIEKLAELHELLEEPDHEDLLKVDNRDFSTYLNISIAPFDELVEDRNFKKKDAEELFLWMLADEKKALDDEGYESVANILSDEDDDYKVLENLLKELAGFNPRDDSIYKPFVEDIGRERKTLMGLAINVGPFDKGKNNNLLDWFIDYIEDENTQCQREPVHEDCFKLYCQIGKRIDEDYANDWLNFDSFLAYINDIIEEGINGSSTGAGGQWDINNIEDDGDLGDWWRQELTEGFAGA